MCSVGFPWRASTCAFFYGSPCITRRKSGNFGSNCTVKFSKGTATQKIGKEKELCKSVNLKNVIRVRQTLRNRDTPRNFATRKMRPQRSTGLGEKCLLALDTKERATFQFSTEAWVMPAPSSKKPEEREFVVDSGASMHRLSKKGSELRRTGLPSKIQEPLNGSDGQWRSGGSTSIRSRP